MDSSIDRVADRSVKSDRWIIGVATLVGLSSLALLLSDNWFTRAYLEGKTGLVVFGRVVTSIKDVKRKISDDFLWVPALKDDPLYEGDSAFTGVDSEAEIQIDKSTIWMEPNSLILFKRIKGVPALDIRQGAVKARVASGQKMGFISRGGTTEVEGSGDKPAEIKMAAQESGNVQVRVVSGEAALRAGDAQQKIHEGQMAEVSDKGRLLGVKSFPLLLVSPKDGDTLLKDSSENVFFSWEAPEALKTFHIQVAYDAEFRVVTLDQQANSNSCEASSKPQRVRCTVQVHYKGMGQSFWRVTSGAFDSGVARFRLFYEKTPSPELPAFGDIIIPGTGRRLQWSDQSGAKAFQVQISKEKDFKTTAFDNVSTANSIDFPSLDEGNYFWRVRLSETTKSAKWSTVSSFTVQKTALTDPPQSLGPEQHKVFILKGGPAKVEFSWKPRSEARSYTLEVSNTSDFSHLIYSESVQRSALSWQTAKPDTYFWRVRAVVQSGQATVYGEVRSFSVIQKK
jgi:hypothetical protein